MTSIITPLAGMPQPVEIPSTLDGVTINPTSQAPVSATVLAAQSLRIAEGANAKQGVATLSLGSVVVSNTSVTANSRIQCTAQAGTLNIGAVAVTERTPGTSFTINSSNVLDARQVAYIITEPV